MLHFENLEYQKQIFTYTFPYTMDSIINYISNPYNIIRNLDESTNLFFINSNDFIILNPNYHIEYSNLKNEKKNDHYISLSKIKFLNKNKINYNLLIRNELYNNTCENNNLFIQSIISDNKNFDNDFPNLLQYLKSLYNFNDSINKNISFSTEKDIQYDSTIINSNINLIYEYCLNVEKMLRMIGFNDNYIFWKEGEYGTENSKYYISNILKNNLHYYKLYKLEKKNDEFIIGFLREYNGKNTLNYKNNFRFIKISDNLTYICCENYFLNPVSIKYKKQLSKINEFLLKNLKCIFEKDYINNNNIQ